MMIRPVRGTPAAADSFERLSDALAQSGSPPRIIEGFLQALDGGVVWIYGPDTRPGDTDRGTFMAEDGGVGIGPVVHEAAAWDTSRFWFRRATAGAAAILSVQAVGI